jgi:ParB family chromosome partitioning protein
MMAAEEGRKRGLGRGLSALLGDEPAEKAGATAPESGRIQSASMVPVELMRPSPYQPRKHFDDDAFMALVESVKEKGVLQPLLVRRDPTDEKRYEIVAGERRWRAAQQARLHEVPVVVKELSDRDTLEVALVENLQREDLTPLEEAEAYRRLMDEFGHTQDELAKAVGKSRSHVANMMRLLNLPKPVQRMLDEGQISAGHARTLVSADDPEGLAREIQRRGLNVRQAEDMARKTKPAAAAPRAGATAPRDANVSALEHDLADAIGLRVGVTSKASGAGILTIHFESPEQLDDVIRRLKAEC